MVEDMDKEPHLLVEKKYEGCWKDDKQNGKGSQYSSTDSWNFTVIFTIVFVKEKVYFISRPIKLFGGRVQKQLLSWKNSFYMNHLKRFEEIFVMDILTVMAYYMMRRKYHVMKGNGTTDIHVLVVEGIMEMVRGYQMTMIFVTGFP